MYWKAQHLPYLDARGTWKSARVERSLLESSATGERAVRLATLFLVAHLLDLMTLLRIEMETALRPFPISGNKSLPFWQFVFLFNKRLCLSLIFVRNRDFLSISLYRVSLRLKSDYKSRYNIKVSRKEGTRKLTLETSQVHFLEIREIAIFSRFIFRCAQNHLLTRLVVMPHRSSRHSATCYFLHSNE